MSRPPPPSSDAPTAPATPQPRAFTVRAVALGVALALPIAWLTPWNDWFLRNAFLYNNYLPAIVTGVLLVIALVVNPLLGARRLQRGELAVVTALLLVIGGVVSSGLMRYWPIAVAGPARHLVRKPGLGLERPLGDDARAAIRARVAAGAAAEFARLDADGDGRLAPAERYDARDGAAWTPDQYVADRVARDPAANATSALALPHEVFLRIPPAGAIDANDAEFKRVVDGYLDGRAQVGAARVGHGARVTWRDGSGAVREQLALSGDARRAHPRADVLDLDAPAGRALAGHRVGTGIATPDGPVDVLSITPAPSVPWSSWIAPALAWAPMIVGLIVASVAAAFLVRQQWLHHERLPYPIATATFSLIDDPEPGRRLPPVMRTRAFRGAAALAFLVVAWRGLAAMDWVTVTIPMGVELHTAFQGEPWTRAYDYWALMLPRIYFCMVGLAFLVPLDVSFSLWFFFLLTNLVTMWLRGDGYAVEWHHVREVGFGGFIAIAPLVVWLGRGWYGRVALACLGLNRDPLARAAAPWLWASIAGLVAMTLWLIANGTPALTAVLAITTLAAAMLVIARTLAEAGVPHLGFPHDITSFMYATFGFGLPAGALMPLALIGMTLLDPREAVLPYAVNATSLADRAAVPMRRLGVTMMAVAVVAAVVAGASMLFNAYDGAGHLDGFRPSQYEIDKVAHRTSEAGLAGATATRSEDLWAYGVGAGLAWFCGIARFMLAWWPVHPLGIGLAIGYPGSLAWGSFLLAWLIKALVMRYGGVALYRSLVPGAIGLIAGEAAAVCLFGLAKIIVTGVFAIPMPPYVNALPG